MVRHATQGTAMKEDAKDVMTTWAKAKIWTNVSAYTQKNQQLWKLVEPNAWAEPFTQPPSHVFCAQK